MARRNAPDHRPSAAYTRISRLTEESTALERQWNEIQSRAAKDDDAVADADHYEDADQSGGNLNRRDLTRLRKNLHRYRRLYIWKLDRLIRSAADFYTLSEELREANCTLVSVSDNVDLTTSTGRLIAGVLASIGEIELENISLRRRNAVAHMKRVGRWAGGHIPYGYRVIPHPEGAGKALDVDDVEAAIITETADRVVKGESVYNIARDFTRRSLPTRRGAPHWSRDTLQAILRKEFITGVSVHNGETVRGDDGLPIHTHPAILTRETWQRVQDALDSRAVQPTKIQWNSPGLLAGLAHCAHCGARMHIAGAKTRPRQYACPTRQKKGGCVANSAQMDLIDAVFERRFLERWGDYALTIVPDKLPDFDDEYAELDEIEEAITDLETAFVTGKDRDADRLARLTRHLDDRADAIRNFIDERTPTNEDGLLPLLAGKAIADVWAGAAIQARRKLLAEYTERVDIRKHNLPRRNQFDPSRVTPVWFDGWQGESGGRGAVLAKDVTEGSVIGWYVPD